MAQRGYYEGVRLLCRYQIEIYILVRKMKLFKVRLWKCQKKTFHNWYRYGADTEDIARISSGLPGFPITITATYHHLKVSLNNRHFLLRMST